MKKIHGLWLLLLLIGTAMALASCGSLIGTESTTATLPLTTAPRTACATHTWDPDVTVIPPTCQEEGSRIYTCTVCHETKTEPISRLFHTFSDTWSSNDAYHWHGATCGCWDKWTDKGDHTWGEGRVISPPSCAEYGLLAYTCTVCGWEKQEFTEKLPHTYSDEWTVNGAWHYREATCGCEVAGADEARHTYDSGQLTAPPTCAEEGVWTYTCTVCEAKKTEAVDRIAHTYSNEWTADGAWHYREATCGCEGVRTDRATHTYDSGQITTPPTCAEEGVRTYTCTVCGATKTAPIAVTDSHSYDSDALLTPPSCTEKGYTTHTCTVCGDSYKDSYTAMIPHPYADTVIPPSCTRVGYTKHSCTACSSEYLDAYRDPLGHTYENILCVRCGEKEYSIGLSYALSEDGTSYTLLGIGDCEDTALILPHTHNGLPVLAVAEGAFAGNTALTSVTFLEGGDGQTVGARAFCGCSSLSAVTLSTKIGAIGASAFLGCDALTAVSIRDPGYLCWIEFGDAYANPLALAHNLYHDGKLVTKLILPSAVGHIGAYAFYGCTPITEIEVYAGVESIGRAAFGECRGVKLLTVPFVGGSATDTENTHFGYIFGAADPTENQAAVPENLWSVTVTGGTALAENAFLGCSALRWVKLPDSVQRIAPTAFYGCMGLTSITVPFLGGAADGRSGTHLGYIFGAADYKENPTYVPKNLAFVTVTGGTAVGSYAFYGCAALGSVTLAKSIESLGDYVFKDCPELYSLTVRGNLNSLGARPFLGCPNVASLTFMGKEGLYKAVGNCLIETATGTLLFGGKSCEIPADGSVKRIASYAFAGVGLTSVTIPKSVEYIGAYAFEGCTALTGVTFKSYAGWRVSKVESLSFPGSAPLSSDPAKNAKNLTGFYCDWYWFVRLDT